jgi:hypothetical protein
MCSQIVPNSFPMRPQRIPLRSSLWPKSKPPTLFKVHYVSGTALATFRGGDISLVLMYKATSPLLFGPLGDVLLLQGVVEIGSYLNDGSKIWPRFNPLSYVSNDTPLLYTCDTLVVVPMNIWWKAYVVHTTRNRELKMPGRATTCISSFITTLWRPNKQHNVP